MSEPSNIFAKDLGIDVNINPVKNDSVYNKPIGITNRDTGIVEYANAYNDIYLCVLHDKDSFGKYDSVNKTFDGSYTDTVSIKISKQNSAFDFAKKFNEYLIHSKYKNNIRFNNFIEDATKDAGKLVYERIQNLANNITNVDTCKWRNLASTYKMYDIDIKNVVSSEFPEELDFLLNIFSLPREYILNNFYKTDLSNNNIVAAAQSMDKKVTDLFQEKYYNNFYEKIVFPAVKQQLYNNFSNEQVFNYIKLVNSNIYDDLYNHIQNNYVEQYYPLFDALLSIDAQNMIYSYYQTMKYDLMYKVPNLNINILTRENPDVVNNGINYLKKFLSTIEWNGEKELFKVFIDEYLPPLAFINMQKIDTCARHITNMCSKLFTLRKSIKDILIKDSMIGTGLLIEQMIYDYILEQFTQKIGINNKYKLGNKEVNYDSISNTPLESIMNDLYNLDPKTSDNYYNEAKIAKLLGVEFDDRFSSLKQLASVLNASIIEYTDTTPNYLNIIPPNPVNHKEVESRTVMTYPRYLNADGVIVYYNYNDPEQSYYINDSGREILPNPRWNYNTANKTRGDIMYVDSSGTDCKILQLKNSSIAPYYYNADNPFYGMWYNDNKNYFIQWQDRQDKENFMSLIEMKNLGLEKNTAGVVSPTNTYNTDLKLFYGNNNRITYNKSKVTDDEGTEKDRELLVIQNSNDSEDSSEPNSNYANAITCAGEVYFDIISKYDDVIETKRVTKVVNSYNDEIIKYVDSSTAKDDNNDITTLLREKPVGTDIKYIKFTKNADTYTAYDMDTFTEVDKDSTSADDAEYIKSECIVSNVIVPNASAIKYSYPVSFGESADNSNLIKLNNINNDGHQPINILIEKGNDSVYTKTEYYTYDTIVNNKTVSNNLAAEKTGFYKLNEFPIDNAGKIEPIYPEDNDNYVIPFSKLWYDSVNNVPQLYVKGGTSNSYNIWNNDNILGGSNNNFDANIIGCFIINPTYDGTNNKERFIIINNDANNIRKAFNYLDIYDFSSDPNNFEANFTNEITSLDKLYEIINKLINHKDKNGNNDVFFLPTSFQKSDSVVTELNSKLGLSEENKNLLKDGENFSYDQIHTVFPTVYEFCTTEEFTTENTPYYNNYKNYNYGFNPISMSNYISGDQSTSRYAPYFVYNLETKEYTKNIIDIAYYIQNKHVSEDPVEGTGDYVVYFISYEYNGSIIDSIKLTIEDIDYNINTGMVYRPEDDVYKLSKILSGKDNATISYNVPYLVDYTYRSKNNPSIIYMEYKNVGPNGETFDATVSDVYTTKFVYPNPSICDFSKIDTTSNKILSFVLPPDSVEPENNYKSNKDLQDRLISGAINPNEVPYLIIIKDTEVYKLDDAHIIKFETIDGIRQVSEISDNLLYEDETGQIIDNKNNLYYYTVDGYDYGDEYTYDYNKRQLIHKSSEKIVNDYSFNVNLVYSLANQKSKIITNEKVVNSLIKEGFDPFWNDLTLDSTLLYGDLTLEDERDIVMFYRRLGLISDDLPTNYKEQLEDGKASLTPEWAIARAKIIDILKAVWTNYAQHTWYNEYDDNKALEDGLMSEATIQMLKEIDKRYGSNLGTTDTLDKTKLDPWLPLDYSLVNLPNWANHTVAVHPFVWSLVQKTYNIYLDTLYITMYDERVLGEIYTNVTSYELNPDGGDNAISKITDRIDETTSSVGELGGYYITNTFDKIFNVNNWLYYNRDFSGYASKYQESINEDSRNSKTSRFFDFDGPFNYEALMEIIEYTNVLSDENKDYYMGTEDLQYLVDTAANFGGKIETKQKKLNEDIWDQIISTYYKYYQDCDI